MADQNQTTRKTWCPDTARYDRGECGWPQCNCPDNGPTDGWQACIASTLAWNMERIDKAVFHYPLELKTAGNVRDAITATIRELQEHIND